MRRLDLNADIGEISGPEGRALDQTILSAVTSCNIACGGHAGDADSMAATLEMAKKLGVRAGAHPSYPDREGFGRRSVVISESHQEDRQEDHKRSTAQPADSPVIVGPLLRCLVEHLPTEATLDRLVLNLFSAERTFLHHDYPTTIPIRD